MSTAETIYKNSSNLISLFNTKDYITGMPQKILKGKNSRLVFVYPQPSNQEMRQCYPKTYYGSKPFPHEKIRNTKFWR